MNVGRELSNRKYNVQYGFSPIPPGTLQCQLHHCIGLTLRQGIRTSIALAEQSAQQSCSCSAEDAPLENKGVMSL